MRAGQEILVDTTQIESVGRRARNKLFGDRDGPEKRAEDEIDTVRLRESPDAPTEPEQWTERDFGRYVIIGELGRGGMGVVMRAYDPKLRREIALKIVQVATMSARNRERLIHEAYAMAKLSHPNVVSVYDFEEVDGRIGLAMQLVDGRTLHEWLRAERPWREVLQVFTEAGRGLAAAHQAGLLHRDFKPANVLISNAGDVQVTDFGLVRFDGNTSTDEENSVLLDSSLTQPPTDLRLTQEGVAVGTPLFMAPEQHAGDVLSPAADQYAFCVSLWYGLAGEPPFPMRDRQKRTSIARRKREGPPPWPKRAQHIPRPIVNALRRGLSPDPARRWPSIEALLEKLSHEADPERRRTPWVTGIALVLGVAGAGWFFGSGDSNHRECKGAPSQMEKVWDVARKKTIQSALVDLDLPYAADVSQRVASGLDHYSEEWQELYTEACEATVLRQERSKDLMDLQMRCLSRAKLAFDSTAEVLASPDAAVLQNAHALLSELPPLSRCEDLEVLASERDMPRPSDAEAVELAERSLARAAALETAGRLREASQALQEAKETLGRIEFPPLRAELLLHEAELLFMLGRVPQAKDSLDDAMRLAAAHNRRRVMAEAVVYKMFMQTWVDQQPEETLSLRPLAEGLSRDYPRVLAKLTNVLGTIYASLGKFSDAEPMFREAMHDSANDAERAQAQHNLARALIEQQHFDQGIAQHSAALESIQAALGPSHPRVALSHEFLARALIAQGRHEDAEAHLRQAIEICEPLGGPQRMSVADLRSALGDALMGDGRLFEAEASYQEALEMYERLNASASPAFAEIQAKLAACWMEQERYDAAEARFQLALDLLESSMPPNNPAYVAPLTGYAMLLSRIGRSKEALPLLERALELGSDPIIARDLMARTRFTLATTLVDLGRDPNRARELAQRALLDYQWYPAGAVDEGQLREIEAWVADDSGSTRKSGPAAPRHPDVDHE